MIVFGCVMFLRLATCLCASLLTRACPFRGNVRVPSSLSAGIRPAYGLAFSFGVSEQNTMPMPVQQAFYYCFFSSPLYLTFLVFKGVLWKLFQNLPRIVQNKIYLLCM